MLNRLKAALSLLFAEQYILATVDSDTKDVDLKYNCCLHNLHEVSKQVYSQSYHAHQMCNLLDQANEVLGYKVK